MEGKVLDALKNSIGSIDKAVCLAGGLAEDDISGMLALLKTIVDCVVGALKDEKELGEKEKLELICQTILTVLDDVVKAGKEMKEVSTEITKTIAVLTVMKGVVKSHLVPNLGLIEKVTSCWSWFSCCSAASAVPPAAPAAPQPPAHGTRRMQQA